MGFETPGKFEIIRTVQKGLNSLEVGKDQGYGVWTTAIKTELCKIGRDRFGYSVYARANEVAEACRDDGEWLYDVTWLEYERERDDLKWPATALINAHWVAVCEWGRGKNFEFIIEEFEKLLLARTGFRLMIFAGSNQAKSEEIAERLARKVREFKGSRAEDAWLLASWEGSHDDLTLPPKTSPS